MRATDQTNPLISAAELNAKLGQKDTKVFDIRGHWGDPPQSCFEHYQQAHIPGAIYLDWTEHFLAPNVALRLAPICSREEAQRTFKSLGISAKDLVVLYDDYHHMLAGRIWWSMRYWGFTRVMILNGGWHYWRSQNLPISTQENHAASAGTFTVSEQAHLRASIENVENRHFNTRLLDGRGPVGYAGDPADSRSGHIPGAINLPYSSLLDPKTGLFIDHESRVDLLTNTLGDISNQSIISSCGSGYAGTVLLVALMAAGIEAPLFDGSIAEWKQDFSRPLEQG